VRGWEEAAGGGRPADEQAVGRRTGLLAAVYSFAQFTTCYAWGLASNRPECGRKPIIVVGNAVTVVRARTRRRPDARRSPSFSPLTASPYCCCRPPLPLQPSCQPSQTLLSPHNTTHKTPKTTPENHAQNL